MAFTESIMEATSWVLEVPAKSSAGDTSLWLQQAQLAVAALPPQSEVRVQPVRKSGRTWPKAKRGLEFVGSAAQAEKVRKRRAAAGLLAAPCWPPALQTHCPTLGHNTTPTPPAPQHQPPHPYDDDTYYCHLSKKTRYAKRFRSSVQQKMCVKEEHAEDPQEQEDGWMHEEAPEDGWSIMAEAGSEAAAEEAEAEDMQAEAGEEEGTWVQEEGTWEQEVLQPERKKPRQQFNIALKSWLNKRIAFESKIGR